MDRGAVMQFKNSNERYGAAAQLLHWSVVVLVVMQFVLANRAEAAHDAHKLLEQAKVLTTHKSIGMTIFMLAVVRLIWRLINPVPAVPPNTKTWQQRASSVVHWSLYALILVTPLAGWLMSSAKNYSVSWFGLFTWPNLVAPDEGFYNAFKETHEILAFMILNVAGLHILAALKHHFWDKDNVLRRVLPVKLK